jgi:ferredoxin
MERPLGYRLLRYGLRVASKTAAAAVDRALERRTPDEAAPPATASLAWRRRAPAQARVAFADVEGDVETGVTLLEAARLLDVDLRHYCGGNCSCGTCRVEVVGGSENLSRPEPLERAVIGEPALRDGRRLACQARVLGPVRVRVPTSFRG